MALRITSCASSTLPDSTRVLIFSFSASVNVTPDLANAVIPLIGSCNALPNCVADCSASPKPAAAKSNAAFVALSKAPPAVLTVAVRFLNVANFAWTNLIDSSSLAICLDRASA